MSSSGRKEKHKSTAQGDDFFLYLFPLFFFRDAHIRYKQEVGFVCRCHQKFSQFLFIGSLGSRELPIDLGIRGLVFGRYFSNISRDLLFSVTFLCITCTTPPWVKYIVQSPNKNHPRSRAARKGSLIVSITRICVRRITELLRNRGFGRSFNVRVNPGPNYLNGPLILLSSCLFRPLDLATVTKVCYRMKIKTLPVQGDSEPGGKSCSNMGSPAPLMLARTACRKCQRRRSSDGLCGSSGGFCSKLLPAIPFESRRKHTIL